MVRATAFAGTLNKFETAQVTYFNSKFFNTKVTSFYRSKGLSEIISNHQNRGAVISAKGILDNWILNYKGTRIKVQEDDLSKIFRHKNPMSAAKAHILCWGEIESIPSNLPPDIVESHKQDLTNHLRIALLHQNPFSTLNAILLLAKHGMLRPETAKMIVESSNDDPIKLAEKIIIFKSLPPSTIKELAITFEDIELETPSSTPSL